MATEPHTKRPGENRLYAVNFGNQPEVRDNGQILTGTPTVSADISGLTLGAAMVASGHIVQFRVSGGTDGSDYVLTVTCGTSDGFTILQEGLILRVRLLP